MRTLSLRELNRATLARQCPTDLDQALVLPLQREVLEVGETGYRFQVELIRRWFATRGHAHTAGPAAAALRARPGR